MDFFVFLLPILAMSLSLAILAAPLGHMILWKELGYFGDSLAHTVLLGTVFSLWFQMSLSLSWILIGFVFFLAFWFFDRKGILPMSNLFGIIAHTSFALSILFIKMGHLSLDLHSYLFGNVLSIQSADIVWMTILLLITLVLMKYEYGNVMLTILDEDIAKAEGISVSVLKHIFFLITMIFIIFGSKFLGILLVNSLLLISSSIIQFFQFSPKKSFVVSAILNSVIMILGVLFSVFWNIPLGPLVTVLLFAIFFVVYAVKF